MCLFISGLICFVYLHPTPQPFSFLPSLPLHSPSRYINLFIFSQSVIWLVSQSQCIGGPLPQKATFTMLCLLCQVSMKSYAIFQAKFTSHLLQCIKQIWLVETNLHFAWAIKSTNKSLSLSVTLSSELSLAHCSAKICIDFLVTTNLLWRYLYTMSTTCLLKHFTLYTSPSYTFPHTPAQLRGPEFNSRLDGDNLGVSPFTCSPRTVSQHGM